MSDEIKDQIYFVQKFKLKRKALGLSQTDLAEFLGLSRVSVTNIETGRQNISLDTFLTICFFLGINFTFEDQPLECFECQKKDKSITYLKGAINVLSNDR